MPRLRRVRVLVAGRVQGVSFRAATRERALELGLRGWVRNLPEGRVEISAEGPADRIDALLAWCREGPPGARVREIETAEEEPAQEAPGFRIVR